MLTGYHEAHRLGAEIIVKMDADGQMDPRYLLPLAGPILRGEADYTKGNRYLHARQLRCMPLLRRVGNVGLSFLTKLASGYWSLFDPTNGYTAIHASLIPLLDEQNLAATLFLREQHALELSLLRAVVRDVYIPARYGNETSHLSELQTLFHFPAALLKGLRRRLWIQYFVRDFSIASLYLVASLLLLTAGTCFRRDPLVFVRAAGLGRLDGHRDAGRPARDPGLPVPAARNRVGHPGPAGSEPEQRPD